MVGFLFGLVHSIWVDRWYPTASEVIVYSQSSYLLLVLVIPIWPTGTDYLSYLTLFPFVGFSRSPFRSPSAKDHLSSVQFGSWSRPWLSCLSSPCVVVWFVRGLAASNLATWSHDIPTCKFWSAEVPSDRLFTMFSVLLSADVLYIICLAYLKPLPKCVRNTRFCSDF